VVVVVLANAAVNTVIAVPPLTIVELDVKAVPVVPPVLLLRILILLLQIMVLMVEAVVPMVEVVLLNAVPVVVVVLANAAVNTVIAVPPLTIVELDVKVAPAVPPILLLLLLLLPIMVMVVVKAVVSNGQMVEAGLGPVVAISPEVRLI